MVDKNSSDKLVGPVEVESLANGGNGIARVDGRVIFIAGAFPGDVAICRLTKEKKKYAEAEVVDLQQPSPLRRIPPCPVVDECGGCQWQQLSYSEQLEWKQRLFSETLIRQAGVDADRILPIVSSPEEFSYRSRVQVKCFQSHTGFVTGFFRAKSRYVVGIESCPLMPVELNRLMQVFRQQLAGQPFAHQIPQLDLSIGFDGNRRAVVHYLGQQQELLEKFLCRLAGQEHFDVALQMGRKNTLRLLHGDGELRISVDEPEIRLTYEAGGFAQINLAQNQKLVEAVLGTAGLQGDEQVLDLYCGMGNFSLPLSRRAKHVTGVEDYFPSINMARRNAAANGIENCDFHAMPAADALGKLPFDFDLLVLDPPRGGAYEVSKQLLEKPIRKIVYVSCDPQTLARDLKPLLNTGYRLVSTQAFDMFPQTYHIESLSVLECKSF